MNRVYYYHSLSDDLVQTRRQDARLPQNHKYLHTNVFYKIGSNLLYGIFWLVGLFYTKLILRVKIRGREKLRGQKNYFLFGNHTQPQGDVFAPALITRPHRPYYLVSPANLGIPIIGKLLPALGALVVPDKIHDFQKFRQAMQHYGKNHSIIVYPEAHLWPYYTDIRPFSSGAFQMAVEDDRPVFCMTTTYQRKKSKSRRPKIIIYIDGPFTTDLNLTKKQQTRALKAKVYEQMKKRSQKSNSHFVKYIKLRSS